MQVDVLTRFGFWLTCLAWAMPLVAQARYEYREVHMGMPVRIVLFAASDSAARSSARAAFARIAQLDAELSDYRSDSELRRIESRAGAWVVVQPATFAVLARALEIAQLTNGAFDPTVAPLVALWRQARTTRHLPSETALDSARALVSFRGLALDSTRLAARLARAGMRLDLGAIAKGFILDEARITLQRAGVAQVLIEAGGDIAVGAPPPGQSGWRIDVPGAHADFAAQAGNLSHAALATSGPTRQSVTIGGTRYSHVIDPKTGLGLMHEGVAYVIAARALDADALATALTVMGPAQGEAWLRRQTAITASVSVHSAR